MYNISKVNNISSYIDSVMAMSDITLENEKNSFIQYQSTGDNTLLQNVVLSHLKYVVKVAFKYYKKSNLLLADLIQAGNLGLLESLYKFKVESGVRFSSFCYFYIKEKILNYLIANYSLYKIATNKEELKVFYNYAKVNRIKLDSNGLTDEEYQLIADELNVQVKHIKSIESKMNMDYVSIENNYEDNTFDIVDENTMSPLELLEYQEYEKTVDAVKIALSKLKDRDRYVIESRFLSENKKTFQELSIELGVSIERVSQIEKEAIKRLKNQFSLFS